MDDLDVSFDFESNLTNDTPAVAALPSAGIPAGAGAGGPGGGPGRPGNALAAQHPPGAGRPMFTQYVSKKNFRQTVCRHWLRGLCMKGEQCGFLHQFDQNRMPICRFFAKFGVCREPECVFKHSSEEVKECNMYNLGFCIHGPLCRYKHIQRPGPPPAPETVEQAKPKQFRNASLDSKAHVPRFGVRHDPRPGFQPRPSIAAAPHYGQQQQQQQQAPMYQQRQQQQQQLFLQGGRPGGPNACPPVPGNPNNSRPPQMQHQGGARGPAQMPSMAAPSPGGHGGQPFTPPPPPPPAEEARRPQAVAPPPQAAARTSGAGAGPQSLSLSQPLSIPKEEKKVVQHAFLDTEKSRFFVLHVRSAKDFSQAVSSCQWPTNISSKLKLNEAFGTVQNVLFLFVDVSKLQVCGCARMEAAIGKGRAMLARRRPGGGSGNSIPLKWLSQKAIQKDVALMLKNKWNDSKLLVQTRDGQEVDTETGKEAVRSFPQ